MAKFLGREVNTDKYLDRVLSAIGYVAVALVVIFLVALLILVLPAAFIADKQSQVWKTREDRKRRDK